MYCQGSNIISSPFSSCFLVSSFLFLVYLAIHYIFPSFPSFPLLLVSSFIFSHFYPRAYAFCSALLQNLVGTQKERIALRKQAEASVDVPYPPLQIVNSIPFCLFSLYLYPPSAPFLNPLSSPSPPSLLSLLINYLSS